MKDDGSVGGAGAVAQETRKKRVRAAGYKSPPYASRGTGAGQAL